ncbi:FtsX-like permease family protein [Nannocystis sp. RBIL2]|uniref:FtsX-like permease family protein n=1 Tax=Nannocystis sp. RBIL2 TaxID=2996788 RepID=UPI00226DC153|nr:FtsX-like permease family protein [Nannocystis sp. RBIL2]MCY1069535.1 FtsX-like permease family protein [Nannocystis sp. RBIL2]
MSLPLRVAWRHLRTRRPPRWTRAVGGAALVLVVAGASAIVWSFGQPPSEPSLELSPADLAYVIGSFAAAIGLLVFSFAATVRGFTLLVAITGYSVAQGCAALVLVLSLLGGLEGDLQRRLLGHRAHLRIAPPAGSEIVNPEPLVTRVQAVPDVVGVSPELAGPIMIRSGFGRAGVNLVGVDPVLHATASGLPDEVVEGDYASFVDPSRLPRRPFPFIDAAGVVSADEPSDMADETGSEDPVEAPPAAEHGDATTVADAAEDSGGWEDPAQEIPRLRAEGKIPPARAPAPAPSPAPEEDDGGGWEDPEQEIPRLRAEGKIPPARPPVAEEAAEEPSLAEQLPAPDDLPAAEPAADLVGEDDPRTVPVLLGIELAAELSVSAGDPVQLITPEGRMTPAGLVPGVLQARVAGVYATGVYDDDRDYAYVPLPDAQAFLRAPGAVTSIAVRLGDPDALAAAKSGVIAVAGPELVVEDWRQIHRGLFSAMFLEKVAMFVALLFVILVAAFGILATNMMSVMERSAEIAILKAMGARDRLIARIFAFEGIIVGGVGCVGGIAAGLALCSWFSERGIPLRSDAFTLEALPLRVDPREVALVAAAALVLVSLASVLPARAAAALRPVDGLRRGE